MKDFDYLYRKGKKFEKNKTIAERKDKGVFYTPEAIVEYMVKNILDAYDICENPYVKILDPSCGAGFFLIKCAEFLESKLLKHLPEVLARYPELEKEFEQKGIRGFIAENSLWGADIDEEAVRHTAASIVDFVGKKFKTNIFCCDSLMDGKGSELWSSSYDIVIGNPPYLGHKAVEGSYKKKLQGLYPGVYKDKSDISYCFIKKGIDILKKDGVLSFITSRYFMEGPSADGLRRYITDKCTVQEIIDFNGYKVFEDAGVAACILTLKNNGSSIDTHIKKYNAIKEKKQIDVMSSDNSFSRFTITRSMLKPEGWRLIPPEHNEIYEIIESTGTHGLGQIMDSCQGIITGCDRAFVLDMEAAAKGKIEKCLLKPWIKNSNVLKHKISASENLLIYSDLIDKEKDYPHAISYIQKHKERLIQRRECRNGIREWYKLQWGRKEDVFERKKLVYPFKASESRFAVDENGYYCSADIYCLVIKEEYKYILTYEYLAAILNSQTFEFYFKCFAKKISSNLYDYYPNTVLRMKMKLSNINHLISKLSRQLYQCKNEDERNCILYSIDREVYNMYGFTEKQIRIIEKEGCGC